MRFFPKPQLSYIGGSRDKPKFWAESSIHWAVAEVEKNNQWNPESGFGWNNADIDNKRLHFSNELELPSKRRIQLGRVVQTAPKLPNPALQITLRHRAIIEQRQKIA